MNILDTDTGNNEVTIQAKKAELACLHEALEDLESVLIDEFSSELDAEVRELLIFLSQFKYTPERPPYYRRMGK